MSGMLSGWTVVAFMRIFHFFVLAGSMAHCRFILKIVVPFAPAA